MRQELAAIQTDKFKQWNQQLDESVKLNFEYIEGVKVVF